MRNAILPFMLLLVLQLAGCKSRDHEANEDSGLEDTTSQHTDSGFEKEADVYENADRVIWQQPDLVIELLGEVRDKTIADLGAGTGYFSRRIAYKGARVIAIDIDPLAIQWMEEQRARFPIELQDKLIIRMAEPDDPKLRPNEVDVVLLVNTYSYINNRIAYFTKLKEAIRRGGSILIIDFKKEKTPFGPEVEDRIDRQQVQDELEAAGYTITLTDEKSLEYQYIIKAMR